MNIPDFRASLHAISCAAIPLPKIDTATLNLVAHLIGHDPLLAETIAAMLAGDIVAEYRYGHLVPVAAKFLAVDYGKGDEQTILSLISTMIHLAISMALDNPDLIDRLFAEVD